MTQTPDRKEGEANEESLLLASSGLSTTAGQTRFFSGKYSFFDENGEFNPNQPGAPPWVYQTSTVDADPGAGNYRTNNATPASVSAIFISEIDNFGLDHAGSFARIGLGATIQIASEADLTETILYRVTGFVDNTNYFTFNVTHEDSSTNFSNFVATEPFRFMLENYGGNGSSGFAFAYDTTVTASPGADPGDGDFALDNADIQSASNMYVANLDIGGVDPNTPIRQAWREGDFIKITKLDDLTVSHILEIDNNITEFGQYWEIPINERDRGTGTMVAGDVMTFQHIGSGVNGDKLICRATKFTAGTINPDQVVFLRDYNASTRFGEIELADASSEATMPAWGIALDAITDSQEGRVLIQGFSRDNFSGLTPGDPMYVSDTAGDISFTPGTVTQRIGIVARSNVLYIDGNHVTERNVIIGDGGIIGTRTIGASMALCGGMATTGGTYISDGNGTIAIGNILQTSGTATMDSGGNGTFVGGHVESATGTSSMSATDSGVFVYGACNQLAAGNSSISGDGAGAWVGGFCDDVGTIIATASSNGGMAHGRAGGGGGVIRADGADASMAFGSAKGASSLIQSTAEAALAGGRASGGGDILASGIGAFSWGSTTGGTISASAEGAVQFAVGTNAVAASLQIGDTTNGLRLQSGGTTSTVNGSFWTDGTDVFVRTGGANVDLGQVGGGDVTGPGASVVDRSVAVYTGTGGLTIAEGNVLIGTGSTGVGTRDLGANGAFCGGFITGGGVIQSNGSGSCTFGEVNETSGSANLGGTGSGAICIGRVITTTGTGSVSGSGNGSLTIGDLSIGISGTANIRAETGGSFARGQCNGASTIEVISGADGGSAGGGVESGGVIRVTTGRGGEASGNANGAGSTIIASGIGAKAHGSVTAGGDILASGDGSLAWASTTGTCTASAAGAIQFGTGVNAVAESLQIGDTTDGLRFQADGTTSTVNGSFWMSGANINIRTDGVTQSLSAAFYDDQLDEIKNLTNKATPVSADVLLIEDSADGPWTKKDIDIGDISIDFLSSATTRIDIVSATAPTIDQVLRATSSTAATWQTIAGGGDVTGGSTSVVGEVATYSSTTGKAIARADTLFGSSSPTVGTRTLGANALISGARITTGGVVDSSGTGSTALGAITQTLGTATITSTGTGSLASGSVVSATSASAIARVDATGAGATAIGRADNTGVGTASIVAGSDGSLAGGRATGVASNISTASSVGSFAFGDAEGGGIIRTITAGTGAFARGYAVNGAVIEATAQGAFASGWGDAAGSNVQATGQGAHALGRATSGQSLGASGTGAFAMGRTLSGSILAGGGDGCFAGGFATGANDITASGNGSFAFGDSTTDPILATGQGAFQWGPGTNAVTDSLQVGDTTDGLRLQSGGTTSTVDGSFWVDGSGFVVVRSSGVSVPIEPKATLHKTITVEDPSASENLSMFYTNIAITVTQVTAVILGSTSVSFDIEHGTSRATATGTGVIGTDEVADSTTTGNITTAGFADATIPADSFIWLSTSALSGTPTQLMVTVEYTED